ncbi:MAG TPA: sensor histidine kinase, partial [Chthoniobacterales bacterium]
QRRAREELEERVAQRTAELTAINEKLQAEIEQRFQLEQEILLISEREKRRIGQDLHDSLCQELAAAAFFLESSAQKQTKKNSAAAKTLSEAARIVNDNVGLARDLARGLHPVELSATGLANALRELAFRTRDGIACHFQCPRPVRLRDEAVALNLYRIAQEAVANALKHGNPGEIIISLERDRKELRLTVEDDGSGIVKKNPKGMGLHIMKYRAGVIGAECAITPREPRGTCVRCILPRR